MASSSTESKVLALKSWEGAIKSDPTSSLMLSRVTTGFLVLCIYVCLFIKQDLFVCLSDSKNHEVPSCAVLLIHQENFVSEDKLVAKPDKRDKIYFFLFVSDDA